MINQIIDINNENSFISKRRGFLHAEMGDGECSEIDLDRVEAIVLSAPQATITRTLLSELGERAIPVVISGSNYQPTSIVMPCLTGTQVTERVVAQIKSSLPKRKRIWQSLVRVKIEHQARVLGAVTEGNKVKKLRLIAKSTRSGDPTNREAYAARIYWQELFGREFSRDRSGGGYNAPLNYGYAILRALVARTVVSVGLLLGMGVHHSNTHNAMCLVDDLMEPYRPVVDWTVKSLGLNTLSVDAKRGLASIPVYDCIGRRGTTTVSNAVFEMVMSLSRVFSGQEDSLWIPEWNPPGDRQ